MLTHINLHLARNYIEKPNEMWLQILLELYRFIVDTVLKNTFLNLMLIFFQIFFLNFLFSLIVSHSLVFSNLLQIRNWKLIKIYRLIDIQVLKILKGRTVIGEHTKIYDSSTSGGNCIIEQKITSFYKFEKRQINSYCYSILLLLDLQNYYLTFEGLRVTEIQILFKRKHVFT